MSGSVLSGLPTAVWIVIGVAAVAYLIIARLRGRPLASRRLLLAPAVFVVLGLGELIARTGHVRALGVVLLAAGCMVSFGFGIARGATVVLLRRDGYLWQRYRPITLLWWLVLAAVKGGMDGAALLLHAPLAAGGPAIMLTLGITLLGETAAVAPRALASGVPFARAKQRTYASEDETWQAPSWRKSVAVLRDKANDGLL
jgi:hypothetical protein